MKLRGMCSLPLLPGKHCCDLGVNVLTISAKGTGFRHLAPGGVRCLFFTGGLVPGAGAGASQAGTNPCHRWAPGQVRVRWSFLLFSGKPFGT